MPMLRALRAAVTFRLRLLLERSPARYERYQLWRGAQLSPFRKRTDLVVCGFPGSGNSYVRAALLAVNPELRIASHGHTWGEVARGVERGLPVLFLLREPRAAISSAASRYGVNWQPKYELRAYATMCERVYGYRDSIVVATFEEATTSIGAVVRRINEKFGTSFVPLDDNDPDVQANVLRQVERDDKERLGTEADVRGAAPSRSRDALKAAAIARMEQPALAALLARCDRGYERLRALRV
jgi:hypothetical protein